ncbi:MAG: NAD(P)/FAD-dependent oxidoreductase [Clostridia bacterium]|nr:NAD(P)/FAD-dependent oxidoreductase [Clostridia bacterium]
MKKVVIIGAGPAGLTAAYSLLKAEENIEPVIVEESGFIGGISRTARFKDNRIDIGGHRFFSKDKEVMELWKEILPLQSAPAKDDIILNRTHNYSGGDNADPEKDDDVFLIRNRVSRIFYRNRFFDYPVSLRLQTFINLGLKNTFFAGVDYLKSTVKKLPEDSLENFYINRFGRTLYEIFFEDYTEKLWGVHPREIAADWGAQRVKGLSVSKVILSAITKPFKKNGGKTETSLIEEFYYPKFGPGQMWEKLSCMCKEKGAEIKMNSRAVKINLDGDKVKSVTVRNTDEKSGEYGKEEEIPCDYVISSMPIKDLANAIDEFPEKEKKIAVNLPYRDFITVGLLLKELEIKNTTNIKTINNNIPDCWIYIQDRSVKLGRLQIFNNWSPYMVGDFENLTWVGLEYFCNEGDALWNKSPEEFISFASEELEKTGIIKKENIVDSFTTKVKKAYPAYFGTYSEFSEVKNYLDSIKNLYCVGRNGQHRYNNMDHSMLTGIQASKAILRNSSDKTDIWNVNTEKEYHEEIKETGAKE